MISRAVYMSNASSTVLTLLLAMSNINVVKACVVTEAVIPVAFTALWMYPPKIDERMDVSSAPVVLCTETLFFLPTTIHPSSASCASLSAGSKVKFWRSDCFSIRENTFWIKLLSNLDNFFLDLLQNEEHKFLNILTTNSPLFTEPRLKLGYNS